MTKLLLNKGSNCLLQSSDVIEGQNLTWIFCKDSKKSQSLFQNVSNYICIKILNKAFLVKCQEIGFMLLQDMEYLIYFIKMTFLKNQMLLITLKSDMHMTYLKLP